LQQKWVKENESDTMINQHFTILDHMASICQHLFNFKELIIKSIRGIKHKIKLVSLNLIMKQEQRKQYKFKKSKLSKL